MTNLGCSFPGCTLEVRSAIFITISGGTEARYCSEIHAAAHLGFLCGAGEELLEMIEQLRRNDTPNRPFVVQSEKPQAKRKRANG